MKHVFFGSAVKTAFTLVVVLLVVVGGLAVAYGTGALGGAGGAGSPTPTAAASGAATGASTPTPSASPSSTPVAPPDTIVAPRPVTTGPGIPTATPIHDAQFTSATSGWVLALFDTATYDASHEAAPGTRILYLISPAGQRFEVGVFSADQQVDLAAWNVAAGKALLELGGSHYAVFDIAANTLGPTWALCGDHPVTAFITPRDDGTWGFRGYCIGAQVDGVYSDTGADVTPADYYRAPFERWDVDLQMGAVAIFWPDAPHPSIIESFPGSDEPTELYWPSGVDSCVPLGVGRFTPGGVVSNIAISCTSGEHVSAWELDDLSIDPLQVATSSAIESFSASALSGGVPFVSNNCVVGNREVLEIQSVDRGAAVVDNGNLTQPKLGSVGAEHCWGASGDVGLYSGYGSLWTSVFGGASVPLIQVPATTNAGDVVGVGDTRAIIAP